MRTRGSTLLAGELVALFALLVAPPAIAQSAAEPGAHRQGGEAPHGEEGHHGAEGHRPLEQMREMHRGHEHEHDFEAMDRLSPERRDRLLALMRDLGLALPPMDPARGRELFVEKGCIACHRVNGIGGDLGPTLNAEDMPEPMNAFEFAARMWRGAPAMTDLQRQMLGDVVTLDGRELANIIAFAHDEQEQAKLSEDDIPARYRALINGQ